MRLVAWQPLPAVHTPLRAPSQPAKPGFDILPEALKDGSSFHFEW